MIDWDSVRHEVTGYLQGLIRIDTTNPPGNEIEAARFISDILSAEGFDPVITESEPGRGNVTARLRGSGSKSAFMLLGHTDVVAVEAEKWSRPPFSGDLHEGCIWGRGALDMKSMVALELMVLLLLKRQGLELSRDVIFAATADEEAGKGNHGIGWLLDNDPGQVEAATMSRSARSAISPARLPRKGSAGAVSSAEGSPATDRGRVADQRCSS